jgi:hypothetical protein
MKNLTHAQLKAQETKYNNIHNEGAEGFNPFTNELERRGNEEFEAMKNAENEEWTKEVTIARRAEFNSHKPTRATLPKIQKDLGYTFFDLQNAIKRHGL